MIHTQLKYCTAGFSVIEMMITMMLSAILLTAGLTIYNQISKGALTVARVINQDKQIMILRSRLTSDLQGLTPLWFTAEIYEKLTTLKKQDAAGSFKKTDTKPEQISKNKNNNFLYAQSQNEQFHFMTFVTTNALQIYGDQPIRTVRVVYLLQPDPVHAATFKLMRKQEDTISTELNIEKLKEGKFDQIADKITSCKMEYGFISKKSETTNTQDKPTAFTFVKQWGISDETVEKNEDIPNLPDVLKLSITIQPNENQESKSYELLCNIPGSQTQGIQSFAEKKYQQERQKKQESTQQNNIPVWRQKTANNAAVTPIVSGNPAGLPAPQPVSQRG